ncbi:MAG: hypothetical protein ACRD2O_00175 [Terriglobia bacterium]
MDLTGLGAIGNVFVNLWLRVREDRQVQAWFKLWTSLLISGVIAGCGMAGMTLLAGKGTTEAVGAGLFAIAASWLGVCSVSPLGRDLIQSLPKAFVGQV